MKYIIIFLFPIFLCSQNSIKITYNADINIDFDTLQGPTNFKKVFKKSIDKVKLLEFSLLVDLKDSITQFEKKNKLEKSMNNIDVLTLNQYLDTRGKYYHSMGKLIHDYNVFDKNLKVNVDNNIKWTLLKEKKKIGNYTCFKALGKTKYGKHKGKTIEAWYSIEIPLPYGPKFYFGLPGLIFEIKEGNTVFFIDSIDYSVKKTNIKTPKNADIISEEEANNIIKEMEKNAEFYFKN